MPHILVNLAVTYQALSCLYGPLVHGASLYLVYGDEGHSPLQLSLLDDFVARHLIVDHHVVQLFRK